MVFNLAFNFFFLTFIWPIVSFDKVRDEVIHHDWDIIEPLGVDHSFIHHTEFLHSLEVGKKSFKAFDVHHVKRDYHDRHSFLNLASVHEFQHGEQVYDTMTSYELYDDAFYMSLDKGGTVITTLEGDFIDLCHTDAHRLERGSYIVGTSDGDWIRADHVARSLIKNNHTSPRVKRFLQDEAQRVRIGLALSRQVESIESLPGSGITSDLKCVRVFGRDVHPHTLFRRHEVDTYFNAVSAAEAGKYNAERGIDLQDRRLATFINAKNGVSYCDDTVEGGQQGYMQGKYDRWNYNKNKGLFWQKGKFDVPAAYGGGEVMFIASGSDLAACVQYAREIDAFTWNADESDSSNIKAHTDPFVFYGSEAAGILCRDCYIYLGARIRLVLSFQAKDTQLRFLAYAGGSAAAFAQVQVNALSTSISKSGTFQLPESVYASIPVPSTGISYSWKNGGMEYEITGNVDMGNGQVRVTAGVGGSAYISPVYGAKDAPGEVFYLQQDTECTYVLPSIEFTNNVNLTTASLVAKVTGTINMKLGKPLRVLGLDLGAHSEWDMAVRKTVTMTYGETPAIDVELLAGEGEGRRAAADAPPVFRPGDVIVAVVSYTNHAASADSHLFISLITRGGGDTPVALQPFTTTSEGHGEVLVRFTVPWNREFQGGLEGDEGQCYLSVRSSQDETQRRLTTPFTIEAYTHEDTIFTSPFLAHGAELFADTPYTVEWNPHLLAYFRQGPHEKRHGRSVEPAQVAFELVGEVLDAQGRVQTRSHYHDFGIFPNNGRATLLFPLAAVGISQGHRFYLVIKSGDVSYVQGWSGGYIRFSPGYYANGLSRAVDVQYRAIDAAFQLPLTHKVQYSRHYRNPADEEYRMRQEQLQRARIDPSQRRATSGCNEGDLLVTDGNEGLAGHVGISSIIGSVDITSSMYGTLLGTENNKCIAVPAPAPTGSSGDLPSSPVQGPQLISKAPGDLHPVPTSNSSEPSSPMKEPPSVVELTGWLVTTVYTDCNQARHDRVSGQIMINVEALGLCTRYGAQSDHGSPSTSTVYILNEYDESTGQVHTWFYAGKGAEDCRKEALMVDKDGNMEYRAQNITLNSCEKLGGDVQMHYAVTSIERRATLPDAEFGPGTGYAYWDASANCGTDRKITKYHIFNPNTCFGVQSMPTHNSRLVSCTNENTTSSTYYGDRQCATTSNSLSVVAPHQDCVLYEGSAGAFGITGPLYSSGSYESTFCGERVPYGATRKGGGDSAGTSDAGALERDLSAAAIAAVVLSLVVAILLSLIMYVVLTKRVPVLGWRVDTKNEESSAWLRRGPGGEDIVELPRRNTAVVDTAAAYPDDQDEIPGEGRNNRLVYEFNTGNPLHGCVSSPPPEPPSSAPPPPPPMV